MLLQTIGHASIVLRNDENKPLLLTDPWLIGSVYWRSWWLQNYPTEQEINELSGVKYCYVTHEHPDHFHTASIRKLSKQPTYISPLLPEENIQAFLSSQGNTAKSLTPFTWYKLDEKTEVLSIPLLNDDSCLLINTPNAIIVNLNDSKPGKAQLRSVRNYIEENLKNKKIIVLSSYSPASIVNSFRKNNEFVVFKEKKRYTEYINNLVAALNADFFIPFASQVIFYRPDSAWANEYKVTFDDIKENWVSKKTTLLHPYSTIDLNTFAHSFVPVEKYNHDQDWIKGKVEKQMQLEENSDINEEDLKRIEKKLGSHRFILWLLFPSGIAFITNKKKFIFKPFQGKIKSESEKYSFAIQVPDQALKDAMEFGHFGDLGITMFTILILNRNNNPKLIYLFFIILTLHDYKHTIGIKNFFKWVGSSMKHYKWRIPNRISESLSIG